MSDNRTMMQYFEWYIKPEEKLWKKVIDEAKNLEKLGITDVWLPPAYKAAGGKQDPGYGVYDLYDLGEFNQKGSIETKYGTKDEYLKAIDELHKNNIRVYADIVLNHKMGADESEVVYAKEQHVSKQLHGLNTIFQIEKINIQNLNGTIHILMEPIGMKKVKKLQCTDLVENIGMKMWTKKTVTMII